MSDPSPGSLDREVPPRAPRWVKISGLAVVAVIVGVIVLVLLGGGPGKHGPGRHGDGGEQTSTEPGHSAPAGGH